MSSLDSSSANEQARQAWDQNAAYWDTRMGDDGNDFVEVLIWPATERLLAPRPGSHILDIACGTGLYSRRLAAIGAKIVAFDFSAEQIRFARTRTTIHTDRIDYRVMDATDETELLRLGEKQFDAAICQMALFDMAEIEPLFRALSQLLKPGGRFLFSIMHPFFNHPRTVHVAEQQDQNGTVITVYSVKSSEYLTPTTARAVAVRGQPSPQPIFHRPLHDLLGVAFRNGFYLDALEERAFPPDHPPGRNPLSWGANFSDIPPVLIARMRLSERNSYHE